MNPITKIHFYLTAVRWTLGFIEEPLYDIVKGNHINVHYLKHNYCDRWFADPWILEVNDDTIKVLVEEKHFGQYQKGYISIMTVSRHTYELLKLETLLQLPTHLSFPAIIRENGKTYIYPENADGEGLGLYELINNKCKHIRTISKALLADAVITDVFGEKLMFSTRMPTHNGNVLSVYRIDIGKGVHDLVREHTFPSDIARNAGAWFRLDGKVYRPAQDCNGGYGKAVIIQEVKRNSDGSFSFQDVRYLTSTHPHMKIGLHTFNHLNGLTVIDVCGYRFPQWVAKTSTFIIRTGSCVYHLIKNIHKGNYE